MSRVERIKALQAQAGEAAALLKLLSHPHRLSIACVLHEGERSVSDIEAASGVRQPGLSRELARLRDAGLVEPRRVSKAVFYRIVDERLETVLGALCDAFAPAALGGERSVAPAEPVKPRPPAPAPGGAVFARTAPARRG